MGLGGGTSYTAIMAIFGVSYLAIPTISLILNLFVTFVGSFNFVRKRHARTRLIVPFLITSIPMSYLGGSLQLSKEVFYSILLLTLALIAARIYLWKDVSLAFNPGRRQQVGLSLFIGAVLGLVAGVVGIGGGIYLVPLILILKLGTEKEAAACGAFFIWVNSLSGLIARFQNNPIDLLSIFPLTIAVLSGGFLGSYLGSSKLAPKMMQKILGGIILVAILVLAKRMFP